MPQIMQPALQARPGGRFMEGVRHGIDLPPGIVPSFKLGWGSIGDAPLWTITHYPPLIKGGFPISGTQNFVQKISLSPCFFAQGD